MPDPYVILIYAFAVACFIIVLNYHLHEDVYKWKTGQTVYHKKAFKQRVIHLTPSAIMLSLFHPFPWINTPFWDGVATVPVAYFLIGATWWWLFDGYYNLRRSTPALPFKFWDVGGTNDPTETDKGSLDEFLAKLKPWQRVTLKLGLVALALACYMAPYFLK